MKRTALINLLALTLTAPAAAQSFYVTVDNPTDLVGTNLSNEVIRDDAGLFSIADTLPADAAINALHQAGDGSWWFSVESPVQFAFGWAEPRDVVRRDPSGVYTLEFKGDPTIPPGASIDALYRDGTDLVMSFDVPVSIGAATFQPADLARYDGIGWSLEFDSVFATIPEGADVTGVDRRGGDWLLTFETETFTAASGTFRPGEIVRWDGASLLSWYAEPATPFVDRTSRFDSLALLAAPGTPSQLMLAKNAATLTLSWADSCSPGGVDDYLIYRGDLGVWYSHSAHDCVDSDGLPLQEDVPTDLGSYYYLVVASNANDEGSYGQDSTAAERPVGAPTCGATSQLLSCP